MSEHDVGDASLASLLACEALPPLDAEDAAATENALRWLLALAASLRELELDEVEPAFGYPRWR